MVQGKIRLFEMVICWWQWQSGWSDAAVRACSCKAFKFFFPRRRACLPRHSRHTCSWAICITSCKWMYSSDRPFAGVALLCTPAVTDVPHRCVWWGFTTAGVSRNVTPGIDASAEPLKYQLLLHIHHFQVCESLLLHSVDIASQATPFRNFIPCCTCLLILLDSRMRTVFRFL